MDAKEISERILKETNGVKESNFTLIGLVIGRSWYNCPCFADLQINTNERGLMAIKKNPLQDYLKYGLQDILYADFDVFETIEIRYGSDITIIIENSEPVEHISAGNPNVLNEIDFPDEDQPFKPIEIEYEASDNEDTSETKAYSKADEELDTMFI
jgi:hypothetical protein